MTGLVWGPCRLRAKGVVSNTLGHIVSNTLGSARDCPAGGMFAVADAAVACFSRHLSPHQTLRRVGNYGQY